MRRLLLASGLLVAGLASAQVFTDDFELWESNMPYYWTGPHTNLASDSISIAADNVHGGNFALRLQNRSEYIYRIATQQLHLDSGTTYLFEYWVRGHGKVITTFFDGVGYGVAPWVPIDTADWTRVTRSLLCQRTTDIGEFLLYASETAAPEHLVFDDFSVSVLYVPLPPLHTIQEIQTPAAGGEASAFVDSVVAIQGIITAWDQNYNSFFLQHGTGPYAGIWVYEFPLGFNIGDEVRLNGKVEEYGGPGGPWPWTGTVTRMVNVSDRILISEDNVLPLPEPLSISDALLEEWEGVLVQVNSLQWTGSPVIFQGWRGTDGIDSVRVHDLCYSTTPIPDVTYNMTGVMHYWDGERKLEPRGPYDLVAVGVPEEARPRVRIYPNPATVEIRVDLPVAYANAEYVIRDPLGRTLQSGRLLSSTSVLDVSGMAPGSYWLAFTAGQERIVSGLVISNASGTP